MKLHLPIGLRKALIAVLVALSAAPAMADNTHVYTDETAKTIAGDDAYLQGDYNGVTGTSSGEYDSRRETASYYWGAYKEYEYTHNMDLEMTGKITNRIET